MTNWKAKTATGAMETNAQSIQSSIDLAVEQVTVNIALFHSLKKFMDEIIVTKNIALINSLKELTGEIIEVSIYNSESVKSLLLKLAGEVKNYKAASAVTVRMEKGR